MADTIELTDGTNTVDFLAATGLRGQPAWVPAVASPTGDGSIPPYITEVIPVIVRNTTADTTATSLQLFHLLQKTAAEYWADLTAVTPVWFNCTIDNETNDRRAFVRSLSIEFTPGLGQLYECNVLDGVLAQVIIVRHPFWEAPSARDMPEGASGVGIVFAYDYTAAGTGGVPAAHDIVGDVGARVEHARIRSIVGGSNLGRVWAGLRSNNKHPTVTNFVPVWEWEDGTLGTDAAYAADGTAMPGGGGNTKITITTIADNVLALRASTVLSNHSANTDDQFGAFLWLLRTQVSAGTWDVQMRWGNGNMPAADFVKGPLIEVSNTSWDFYELGEHPIPNRNLHALPLSVLADTFDDDYALQIYASRTSGAGTLDLDCVVLIPLDEGYLILKDFILLAGATPGVIIGTSPEDEINAVQVITTQGEIPTIDDHGFTLPPGDGRMIILYARDTTSNITDTITVNVDDAGSYYERWLSLRGAE